MKTKIIVIVGPTAVGKTALSLDLAQLFEAEIISGDSQQVYRGLDIGTAKVSPEEQALIPHHLIDVREISESYSAHDFVTEARRAIETISQRGKLVIIAGGTGLYLQSLLEGYHLGGQAPHQEVLAYRKDLEKLSDQLLFEMVEEARIEIKQINRRRAIRALELARFGQDLSNQKPAYEALVIGLNDERSQLYERINQRVDQMVEAGLVAEAKWLYERAPKAQATRGIGYKELFPYFEGEVTLEQAIEQIKQNTRRFAKRQLTWFKNRMQVDFYQLSDPTYREKIIQEVKGFLHD
ncbi:tRNA (adenosine(37)-N6)-dimethylallyltransferase MiaA [Streptococcus oricebi]|uniref:tRNA dimethylallyltransferase n=1 Tax=Streptococcus oricebi TaxID=1547447 RepID=A0ABS5B158_9STRE|nr:tRNA (adenosine(37)-N6)-dimethylallyltransferase MiaA [Streptococcus oricebi]MBP2622561.1 tRNA (adenosine(37)-N6)-dimethylallyltransferase MiaA [Streptococcus oricebi]